MKNIFLRLLSLLLIFAMFLPMAISCEKDPPPSDDDDEESEGEQTEISTSNYIDAIPNGKDVITIADFSSPELINRNNLGNKASISNGSLSWDMSKGNITVYLPSDVTTGVFHFVEFTVTVPAGVNETSFYIKLPGCEASYNVVLEGAGVHDIQILCDSFSVKDPYPTITGVELSSSSTNKCLLTISNIVATTTKYKLAVPEGVSLDDPAIYNKILENYREMIVGKVGGYEHSSFDEKVSSVNTATKNMWNYFKSTSSELDTPETLFEVKVFNLPYAGYGTPYKNGGYIQDFYENIRTMAYGYGTWSSDYYKNQDLLADILTALEYGYTFYYGKELVEGTDRTHGNWWEWDIGIPFALVDTLVIIADDIPSDLIFKYLAPYDMLVPHPMGTGANRTWMTQNCILAGALEHDAYRICVAKEFMNEVFYYVEDLQGAKGDGGFYKDGSFIQHGNVAYSGGYGLNVLNYSSGILAMTSGSPLDFHGEHIENQYKWIYESYLPVIYGTKYFSSTAGREVNRKTGERSRFETFIGSLAKVYSYTSGEEKTKLASLIKYFMLEANSNFTSIVALPYRDTFAAIYSDNTVQPMEQYVGTKVFAQMDRVVHHGPEYGVCISLSSTRITKYEAINGENATGWFHGDAMIYIYTDGYDYSYNFFWYANPYRMPGTTVNTAPLKVQTGSIPASNTYSGGVAQGKYGAVGYTIGIVGSTMHTVANQASTTGNKSYFFFDNEIICVGTDINDNSNYNVITTVENRIWRNSDIFTVNGSVTDTPLNVETTVEARTMHFTNMGGYVFLRDDGLEVKYVKTYKSGQEYGNHADATEKRSFLEIVLDHGKGDGNVENSKYFYAYLPEASVEETENYYTSPDVALLTYKPSTHAVIEKTLGIVACNFFEYESDVVKLNSATYGSITGVTEVDATTPCSVMITKNDDGSYAITLSDPTQTYQETVIDIKITGITEVVSKDDKVNAAIEDGVLKIKVNSKNACGQGFNLTVR